MEHFRFAYAARLTDIWKTSNSAVNMMIYSYLFAGSVAVYTLSAAITDIRYHRIPNYLTVPAAVLGLLFHTFAPNGWGIVNALAGFAVGFGLLLMPWILGGGGMGDVKLLAALGTWLGPKWMIIAFGLSIAIAAAMALCVMAFNGTKNALVNSNENTLRAGNSGGTITAPRAKVLPFAVPVALCAWVVVLWLLQKGALQAIPAVLN